jgi:hypothetical protein
LRVVRQVGGGGVGRRGGSDAGGEAGGWRWSGAAQGSDGRGEGGRMAVKRAGAGVGCRAVALRWMRSEAGAEPEADTASAGRRPMLMFHVKQINQ